MIPGKERLRKTKVEGKEEASTAESWTCAQVSHTDVGYESEQSSTKFYFVFRSLGSDTAHSGNECRSTLFGMSASTSHATLKACIHATEVK